MMSGSATMDSMKIDVDREQLISPEGSDGDGGRAAWFPATHQIMPQARVAQEWIASRRQGLRSWREFIKTDKFSVPKGPAILTRRIVRNVEYFQSNYICVFVVLAMYCILTSPMLIIALAACFGLLYIIKVKNAQTKLRVAGRELSPAYQYAVVALLSFPLFYVAGAGSVIFWVIGASIFVIVFHAAIYASEEIPGAEFEQETV